MSINISTNDVLQIQSELAKINNRQQTDITDIAILYELSHMVFQSDWEFTNKNINKVKSAVFFTHFEQAHITHTQHFLYKKRKTYDTCFLLLVILL